ncbi:MAG: STN domain-containing protein [Bacteroidales bacterium]|nr:STN domain-containing protein [Bacteroidales bacterium]
MKKLLLFIVYLWLNCLTFSLSYAQTGNPDQITSLSAINEPVDRVLDRLSRNTGITFSYNPDHIEASRMVSVNLTNKKLSEILAVILPPEKFGFRFSGNQVVIFRKASASQTENAGNNPLPDNRLNKPAQIPPDTVFLTQTQILRDTVALTDTIVKFDTVYIMRTVTRDNPITGKDIFSNQTSLPEEQTRELKFEAGFSVTWLFATPVFDASDNYSIKLEEYRDSYSSGLSSGTAGLDLRMSFARFSFNTGVSYTSFKGKLDYTYQISTGGYFLKDTLDAYYTLTGIDTAWFYVLDSVYLPIDNEAYSYKTSGSHRYFEIPFTFQYNHPFRKMLIYASAGLIAGIHSGSDGYLISSDQDGVVSMAEVEFKPLVFSSAFAAGLLIPVSGKFTFDAGISYRQHMSTVLSGFPVEVRSRAFGLRAGLIYKL